MASSRSAGHGKTYEYEHKYKLQSIIQVDAITVEAADDVFQERWTLVKVQVCA